MSSKTTFENFHGHDRAVIAQRFENSLVHEISESPRKYVFARRKNDAQDRKTRSGP